MHTDVRTNIAFSCIRIILNYYDTQTTQINYFLYSYNSRALPRLIQTVK